MVIKHTLSPDYRDLLFWNSLCFLNLRNNNFNCRFPLIPKLSGFYKDLVHYMHALFAKFIKSSKRRPIILTNDNGIDSFRLVQSQIKAKSKLLVTGLCEGNSSVAGEFLAQRASNAKNVFIWWRHHDDLLMNIWVLPCLHSTMSNRWSKWYERAASKDLKIRQSKLPACLAEVQLAHKTLSGIYASGLVKLTDNMDEICINGKFSVQSQIQIQIVYWHNQ